METRKVLAHGEHCPPGCAQQAAVVAFDEPRLRETIFGRIKRTDGKPRPVLVQTEHRAVPRLAGRAGKGAGARGAVELSIAGLDKRALGRGSLGSRGERAEDLEAAAVGQRLSDSSHGEDRSPTGTAGSTLGRGAVEHSVTPFDECTERPATVDRRVELAKYRVFRAVGIDRKNDTARSRAAGPGRAVEASIAGLEEFCLRSGTVVGVPWRGVECMEHRVTRAISIHGKDRAPISTAAVGGAVETPVGSLNQSGTRRVTISRRIAVEVEML